MLLTNTQHLALACAAMVALTFIVGMRMLYSRVREMLAGDIPLQAIATSAQLAGQLRDTQAADNFRNLFEVPVLFYALCAMAIATAHVPSWLVWSAWLYVCLRALHSAIHTTYNRVAHRFAAFATSFALLLGLWLAFVFTLIVKNAA